MTAPKLCCPHCGGFESIVTNCRPDRTGLSFVRKRRCEHCGARFLTHETIIKRLPSIPPSSTSTIRRFSPATDKM